MPASALKTSRASAQTRSTKKVAFEAYLLGTSPTGRVFALAAKEERETNAVVKIQMLVRHWLSRGATATNLAKATTSSALVVLDGSPPSPSNKEFPTLLATLPAQRVTKEGSETRGNVACIEQVTCSTQRSGQKHLQVNPHNGGRIVCRRMLRPWMQLLDLEARPRIFEDLSASVCTGSSTPDCQSKERPFAVPRSAAEERVAAVRLAAERWTTGFRPGARAFVMRAARPLHHQQQSRR